VDKPARAAPLQGWHRRTLGTKIAATLTIGMTTGKQGGTAVDPDSRARLDETMAQIAGRTGATLHVYHHPGRAARRVVLRDTRNDRGTQVEAAHLDDDGTLRVTGHHTGPGVSEFFGDAITCYDWAYVIAPGRVGTLFTLLGGQAGDDVPGLLATYHGQHGGQINDLLRGPQVAATFSNWHS
jgi:hypothetical protein